MAIYFFDKNQALIKIVPESATFEAIQTQELDDDSLLKDTLSVTIKGDEKLLNAEYMAVKSYTGNAQTFDMYRIVTDTTPDKTMSFTGMSLAPYELNGHIIQDLRPANHSLEYTLNRVLTGTDWRLGYMDDGLSNVTTTFYYVSAKEALKELQSLVGCEFVFKVEISGQKITDKWIEVYSEMGNRTKKRFNYGTNALTVVRETNKADIYTALIGRGKGEEVSSGEENESGQAGYGRKITFEDIEWSIAKGNPLDKPKGQYYLELPQATQAYGIKNIDGTMKARVGIVDFDDEEDKNRLINLTYQQLLVSSRPKVLFKTTVANVGATSIGDTVTIHRHDLNIHYQTRVRKIVRNKLNDNKTQIELGDAVVTASTKRAKENNATIKNLTQELEKVKDDVTTSQTSADGKNTIFYGSKEPERQRTGDTWYRPHPSIAGETQMLVWNGTAWELVVDSSDLTSVAKEVEAAAKAADEAVQAAEDADVRANEAIEKAGANADLLTTHQNTLNAIKNTTIPNINSSISGAISEAKAALSSASSAMEEARKTDGKIADYVTRNGLVSGTTVDTKINEATGEISKKITTVESKIPTEIGGRNYVINSNFANGLKNWQHNPERVVADNNVVRVSSDGSIAGIFQGLNSTIEGETYTFSAYVRGTGQVIIGFDGNYGTKDIPSSDNFTRISWTTTKKSSSYLILYTHGTIGEIEIKQVQAEKGSILTDWKLAPEDTYTQEDFSIFESTYNENVKGINYTLTELSNKKLDGTTYTNFYNNEYKKTAKGVTDTWEAVNKIVDENGNTTDTFAQAIYERNAERQKASFKEVTDDLVTTATYTAGINGLSSSISTVQGNLDNLSVGGRNLLKNSDFSNGLVGWGVNGASHVSLNTDAKTVKVYKGASNAGIYGRIIEDMIVGESYTYSAEVKGVGYIRLGADGSNRAVQLTSADWERVSHTITFDINTSKIAVFFAANESSEFEMRNLKVERGNIATDWTPSISEQMGKAEFTIFKNDYDETAKIVERRLTAIDSTKEGSVVTRLNKTEKTASGNTTTISNIKTKPGEQITGYQTIKERSDLYERVIGSSSEASVKENVARIVMTDSVFKTEVIDKTNVDDSNTFSSSTKVSALDGTRRIAKNTELTPNGFEVTGAQSNNGSLRIHNVITSNGWWTVSGWVRGSQIINITFAIDICNLPSSKQFGLGTKNEWQYFEFSYNVTNHSSTNNFVDFTGLWFAYYFFKDIKIEKNHHATAWTPAVTDVATQSQITQLADNINLKVSKGDLLSQINVQAGGVLITSGTNKLNVTPETTYIEDGTIKSAMIESLEAGKIKTGTLDAGKVKVINIDAENITANQAKLIQAGFTSSSGGTLALNGDQILSTASDGSKTTIGAGRVNFINPNGAGLGGIGYEDYGSSPYLTLRTSWGSHFRITARVESPTGDIVDKHVLTVTADREMYLNTDDTYVMGNMTMQKAVKVGGHLSLSGGEVNQLSRVRFAKGAYLEEQVNGNTQLRSAGTELQFYVARGRVMYSEGTRLMLDLPINMQGNGIFEQSDERIKTDIKPLGMDSLNIIQNVDYKSFTMIKNDRKTFGFIAQQMQELAPNIIHEQDGLLTYDSMEYTHLIGNALQQHVIKTNDEISQLKAQIASLQDELALLKGA